MRAIADTNRMRTANESEAGDLGVEASTLTPAWLEQLIGGLATATADDLGFAIEHVQGPPAVATRILGAVTRARAASDKATERDACWALAIHLNSQGIDVAAAIRHGSRAIALGDNAKRSQVAAWLECTGDLAGAAEMIRPLVVQEPGVRDPKRHVVHLARMLSRAGRVESALQALIDASAVDPKDTEALALADDLVAMAALPEAVATLLAAADRHDTRGDDAKAFQARERAFTLAPESELAADALVASLDEAHRWEAADGVLKRHAAVGTEETARATHRRRLTRLLAIGQTAPALAVVVDGQLEASVHDPIASHVDDLLESLGLHEVLAVRWLLRAATASGTARAVAWTTVASLQTGRLASPDRALEAWIEGLAVDSANVRALEALRSHARAMHDPTPLAEALIRASSTAATPEAAAECLRELATIAEGRLSDPSLAHWAFERIAERLGTTDDVQAARQRLAPRVRLQDVALASARATLEGTPSGDARKDALRRAATILRGRPPAIDEYLALLRELVESGQGERRWWLDFERASRRAGRLDMFEQALRSRLSKELTRADAVHFRMLLVELRMHRGDPAGALAELRGLGPHLAGVKLATAYTWVLATSAGNAIARAEALETAAASHQPELRATLLAAAGEMHLAAGRRDDAARIGELAQRADPSAPRVVALLAELACRMPTTERTPAIEKAWATFLPEDRHHEAMAEAFDQAGDFGSALAWCRRRWELRPWDAATASKLVRASVRFGKADSIAQTILTLLASAHPFGVVAADLAVALRELDAIDAPRALAIAVELLARGGAGQEALREAMVEVARRAGNERLETAIHESSLSAAEPAVAGRALLRIAALRGKAQDEAGEASALVRAAALPGYAEAVLSNQANASSEKSGDAHIWRLEARATALTSRGAEHAREAARGWLQAGAARWDLGDDRDGAMTDWMRACLLVGDGVFAHLGRLLPRFAGEGAVAAIAHHAASLENPSEAAGLLVVASALELGAERPEAATALAMRALEQSPSCTEALLLVERASAKLQDAEAVDRAYAIVAQFSMGRFGRRAAHFRAARALETRGRTKLAVVHAIAAFEADPVDGAVVAMLRRAAEVVDPSEVIQCFVRVSERDLRMEAKAFWLRCAVDLASKHDAHARTAVDLGLRALLQSPSEDAVNCLENAMRAVLRQQPDDREILKIRADRAVRSVAATVEGPIGARIAIALASVSTRTLGAPNLAWRWIDTAFACSGDVDEYEALVPLAGALASCRDRTEAFLDATLERTKGFGGTTGPGLFALAESLANTTGDQARGDRLKEAREAIAHEDAMPASANIFADLIEDDEPSARTAGQARESLGEAESLTLSATLEQAAKLEASGELSAAIGLLENAAQQAPERLPEFDADLRRLYSAAGRNTKLAIVLERIAERVSDSSEKLRLLVEMASLLEARDDLASARIRWTQVADIAPGHSGAIAFLERDAVDRGDYEALASMLRRRAEASPDQGEAQALRLRGAILMWQQLRKPQAAAEELDALIRDLGEDVAVLQARADLAEEMGDEALATECWQRGASVAATPSEAASLASKANAMRRKMQQQRAGMARQTDDALEAERLRKKAQAPGEVTEATLRQAERIAREASGVDRAIALRQLARLRVSTGSRSSLAEAEAYYTEAMAAATADGALRAQIEAERSHVRGRARTSGSLPGTESVRPPDALARAPVPPRVSGQSGVAPPNPTQGSVGGSVHVGPMRQPERDSGSARPPPARESSVSGPSYAFVEPRDASPSRAPAGTPAEDERELLDRLAQGDLAAGDRVAQLLGGVPSRTQDLVAVRRRQVILDPTNLRLLAALRDAALADRDRVHATAVEHVIEVLRGDPGSVQPPPITPPSEPDRLHMMLFRGVRTDASELFAHVWENASHLFARDPAAFGLTGLERVAIGAPTPMGRTVATAARGLGLMKTPVFRRRTSGPLSLSVVLLQSPAVVVSGDGPEDPAELAGRLGAMIAATMPSNAMLFGMPATAVKQLMAALATAFGPPEEGRGRESESAILAGELWRAVPGRAQQRMQQILKQTPLSYDDVWARALQVSRRAGLFVTGNLRIALLDVANDPGTKDRVQLASRDALRSLCQTSTSAADLLRFATSVEYAQARWREELPRRGLTNPGLQ